MTARSSKRAVIIIPITFHLPARENA